MRDVIGRLLFVSGRRQARMIRIIGRDEVHINPTPGCQCRSDKGQY
jgi:hypothetical protein